MTEKLTLVDIRMLDNLNKLNRLVNRNNLKNLGSLNLMPDEIKKTEVKSLVFLGPNEPNFWDEFSRSSERIDDLPDPLDRWTRRVLSSISAELNARVFFPFDGPPYWPFYSWALRSGKSFQSPINFLVHKRVGLFVSFRGAIGFQDTISGLNFQKDDPPCDNCERPCEKACPVDALTVSNYDDKRCRDFVVKSEEDSCSTGCLVRRSCPVGHGLRRPEQSKFHMSYFIKK